MRNGRHAVTDERATPPAPERSQEIERTARRGQAAIGGLGLALLLAFSVFLFTRGSTGSPGVAAGEPLAHFVAPLALSDLNATANVDPRCDPLRPARRGLNVCGRSAIALDLFVVGARTCVASVDALQSLQRRFVGVELAAVAVGASRAQAAALARAHGWTIPVAYDSDAAVAALYRVSVCPLLELARRGGTVARRLIGRAWTDPAKLGPQIAALARP